MRFFIVLFIFLGAASYELFGGLIEHAFYSWALDLLKNYLSGGAADLLVRVTIAAIIMLVGLVVAWPTRPSFMRRRPIKMFLERDSGTDQYGIQSFPSVAYIQIAMQSTAPIVRLRGWVTRCEYSQTEEEPFAIEHNERHPLIWSKHGGTDAYIADLNPGEPPVRINVLISGDGALQFDTPTPTNLLPRLQRQGFHRLTINFQGERHMRILHFKYTYPITEAKQMLIEWRGAMGGPRVVWLK